MKLGYLIQVSRYGLCILAGAQDSSPGRLACGMSILKALVTDVVTVVAWTQTTIQLSHIHCFRSVLQIAAGNASDSCSGCIFGEKSTGARKLTPRRLFAVLLLTSWELLDLSKVLESKANQEKDKGSEQHHEHFKSCSIAEKQNKDALDMRYARLSLIHHDPKRIAEGCSPCKRCHWVRQIPKCEDFYPRRE